MALSMDKLPVGVQVLQFRSRPRSVQLYSYFVAQNAFLIVSTAEQYLTHSTQMRKQSRADGMVRKYVGSR